MEDSCLLVIDGEEIFGEAGSDLDRTTADGKASSVQFIHFPLNEKQAATFKQVGARITLGIRHPAYGHLAILPETVRAALALDLD